MISGDHGNNALLLEFFENHPQTIVNCFTGLNRSRQYSSMANHVTISKIQNNEIIRVLIETLDQLLGYGTGTHLRLQVVGFYLLWRRNQTTLLPGKRLFTTTVEEKGNVSVLFGLRNPQLTQAPVSYHLPQTIKQGFRRKDNRQTKIRIILRHADIGARFGETGTLKAAEIIFSQGHGNFTSPITAKVKKNNSVTTPDQRQFLLSIREHKRLDKLIVDLTIIRFLKSTRSLRKTFPLSQNQHPPMALYPIPTLIPVHPVKTTAEAGNPTTTKLGKKGFQTTHISNTTGRWGISTIEKGMHINPLKTMSRRQP